MSDALEHPAVQRLIRVARALDGLPAHVVFIGGSIAPLLQTDPPFDRARPTDDVDAVVASANYGDLERLGEALHQRHFRQVPGDARHLHRWRSSADDLFDLVPAGSHVGGTGGAMDRLAIETSDALQLSDGFVVRHASAAAFLGLKWAAHNDRGAGDPHGSHDLEDIIALIASRPTIVADVGAAPPALREVVVIQSRRLLDNAGIDDIIAGHLNNAQNPARIAERVKERLREISAMNPADGDTS